MCMCGDGGGKTRRMTTRPGWVIIDRSGDRAHADIDTSELERGGHGSGGQLEWSVWINMYFRLSILENYTISTLNRL